MSLSEVTKENEDEVRLNSYLVRTKTKLINTKNHSVPKKKEKK